MFIPAGEKLINKFESIDLENGLYKYGHKNVSYIKNEKDIAKTLLKIIKPNDIIICLGAGSITKIANKLEENLNNELK
jgi:UDP-N-acetylmuramate--alanine ligase